MDAIRKIRKVLRRKPTMEGAGVHLNRVFGFGETFLFDPAQSREASGIIYRMAGVFDRRTINV